VIDALGIEIVGVVVVVVVVELVVTGSEVVDVVKVVEVELVRGTDVVVVERERLATVVVVPDDGAAGTVVATGVEVVVDVDVTDIGAGIVVVVVEVVEDVVAGVVVVVEEVVEDVVAGIVVVVVGVVEDVVVVEGAGTLFVTEVAPTDTASFPAESCTALASLPAVGSEYATVTDSLCPTADASVNSIVEPDTATLDTLRNTPPTVTAKADVAAVVADNASEYVKITFVPVAFTDADENDGLVVSANANDAGVAI